MFWHTLYILVVGHANLHSAVNFPVAGSACTWPVQVWP